MQPWRHSVGQFLKRELAFRPADAIPHDLVQFNVAVDQVLLLRAMAEALPKRIEFQLSFRDDSLRKSSLMVHARSRHLLRLATFVAFADPPDLLTRVPRAAPYPLTRFSLPEIATLGAVS